jgi:ferric-dicitrate binding protein FerR (iron transport regulator)
MASSHIDPADGARCDAMGDLIADTLARAPEPHARQWARIEPGIARRRRARRLGRWSVRLVAPVLLAGAAAAWVFIASPRHQLTYVNEGCEISRDTGLVVSAADRSGRLTFSDGSRIVLGGGTRGRLVLPNRPSSAELVLDNGAAELDVVHRRNTRWDVKAGPFRVDVKGTQFRLSWSPGERRFRLEMLRGEVVVTGGTFPASLVLRTGKVLEVLDDKMSVRDADAPLAGAGDPRRGGSDSMSTRAANPKTSLSNAGAASEKDDTMDKNHTRRAKRPTRLAAAASAVGALGLLATASSAAPPAGHGSPVFIGADGKLSGPMAGYAWVAGAAETTVLSPSPCNTRGCFKDTKGQLCTRGRIPALRCTGHGTAQFSCNWESDWGATIGLNTAGNGGPWLTSAPSSVSIAYHGGRGTYRLNAHVAGDPADKVYCVDGYLSGQVVAAGMLKTACWSDSGEALGDFQRVDQLNLEIVAAESPMSYDYCVTDIAVNGSAGQTVDDSHVVIEDSGKLGGQMSGYAWVAGGAGTSFTAPQPCTKNGCFSDTQGRLCAKGTIAPLACTGLGTPQLSCDWTANWGGMIGLNANVAVAAWGANAPSTVAVTFSGPAADYRLMAHVAGAPDAESYCIDGYESGQVVEPRMLKTKCWSDGGAPLTSFQTVDKIGLQIMAAETSVPIDVCISDIVAH